MKLLKKVRQFIALTIATGLGSGFVPKAPGTAGTVVAVALWWFLPPLSIVQLVALLLLILAVGTWASVEAEIYFKKKDPGSIVIDEVLGFFISASPAVLNDQASLGYSSKEPGYLLLAFLLFRVFDIMKPYPANRWDHLSKKAKSPWVRALAIQLDDVIAGIYAGVLTWCATRFIS